MNLCDIYECIEPAASYGRLCEDCQLKEQERHVHGLDPSPRKAPGRTVTAGYIATQIGQTPRNVINLIHQGKICAWQAGPGHAWFINEAEAQRFLSKGSEERGRPRATRTRGLSGSSKGGILVSRRNFLRAGTLVALIAGGLCGALERIGRKAPVGPLIDTLNAEDSPTGVAQAFREVSTPSLLALYAAFFPSFLKHWGRSGPAVIREAAESEKLNPGKNVHRLDAAPAVVAAHLLPMTLQAEKGDLWETISQVLRDPRREVREIVLQNLISAGLPDFDTSRFFALDEEVLAAIERCIEEAKSTAKLLTPLCFATQLLLNLKTTLASRGESAEADRVARHLQVITESNVPHFSYARHLASVHEELFRHAYRFDPYSLPPHITEALMGWHHLPLRFQPYLEALSLVHARNTFSIWETTTGSDSTQLATMSQGDAKQALPKALSFIKNFDTLPLLRSARAPIQEPRFERFLRLELPTLLEHPEYGGLDPSALQPTEEEVAVASRLSQCVPLARWRDRNLLCPLALDRDLSRRDFFFGFLTQGRDATPVIFGITKAVEELLLGLDVPAGLVGDLEAVAQDAADRAEDVVNEALLVAADEQEARLGPAELPRPSR